MRHKQAMAALQTRIASMQSQLLIGGQKIEDTPQFRWGQGGAGQGGKSSMAHAMVQQPESRAPVCCPPPRKACLAAPCRPLIRNIGLHTRQRSCKVVQLMLFSES